MSFVVMDNVFFSKKYKIQEQYDLKGSTVDRQVKKKILLLCFYIDIDLCIYHYYKICVLLLWIMFFFRKNIKFKNNMI